MSDVLDELRQLLLGDLYDECKTNPNGVSRDKLEDQVRLLQEQGCVGDCTVDNVVSLCRLNMKTMSIDACGLGCASSNCIICSEPFTPSNPAIRLCSVQPRKHCFHQACIDQWMQQKQSCPICRGTLKRRVTQQAEPLESDARVRLQARVQARREARRQQLERLQQDNRQLF